MGMGMAGAFGTFVRERYGMAGKDRGRADSRFLGDKAAFGMTKLRLPSNGTAVIYQDVVPTGARLIGGA